MQRSAIRAPISTIIIMLVCAYFARSALQIELSEREFETGYAQDLSLLVVPPILGVLMFPILRSHRKSLMKMLSPQRLNLRIILAAIAIGLLARIFHWGKIVFTVSTGYVSNSDPAAVVGPAFSWNCPPSHIFLLGLLVWIVITPVIEEVIHRGLIQTPLMRRGRWTAILISAAIFAVFHKPESMPFVFLFGMVFGIQFANCRSLWATIITHATYDGLIQFDSRCLNGAWNPPIENTPILESAILSFAVLALSATAIIVLLKRAGAVNAPRHSHQLK